MNRRTFITAILGTAIAAKIFPKTPVTASVATPTAPPMPPIKWIEVPHCPPDRIFAFDPNDFVIYGDGSGAMLILDPTKTSRVASIKNISL